MGPEMTGHFFALAPADPTDPVNPVNPVKNAGAFQSPFKSGNL
jgi:hypothetical protein